MGLWAEPMTAQVATVLLAGLATLFILIYLEIRSNARAENPPPPKPDGQSLDAGAIARVAVLLALIQLALSALILFVVARRGGGADSHLAFDAAGSIAACVFYTWAPLGFVARRASAIITDLGVEYGF